MSVGETTRRVSQKTCCHLTTAARNGGSALWGHNISEFISSVALLQSAGIYEPRTQGIASAFAALRRDKSLSLGLYSSGLQAETSDVTSGMRPREFPSKQIDLQIG
jgi:hypothetical protein